MRVFAYSPPCYLSACAVCSTLFSNVRHYLASSSALEWVRVRSAMITRATMNYSPSWRFGRTPVWHLTPEIHFEVDNISFAESFSITVISRVLVQPVRLLTYICHHTRSYIIHCPTFRDPRGFPNSRLLLVSSDGTNRARLPCYDSRSARL